MKRTHWIKLITSFLAAIGVAVLVVACGGSGSGSNQVVGTITGFGSVYIDGVEYSTDSTEYEVDDDDATDQDDLEEGMVITCEDDGAGGCASIHYDADLEAPVTSVVDNGDDTKTLVVLGVSVLVSNDPLVTNFDNDEDNDGNPDSDFSYATVAVGDRVEISGVFNNGVLEASYIEKEGTLSGDSAEVEFKGTITAFDASTVTTALDSNGLAVIIVSYNVSTDLGDLPGGVLATGLFVEVEGTLTVSTGDILALEIEDESENDDHDYDDDHS